MGLGEKYAKARQQQASCCTCTNDGNNGDPSAATQQVVVVVWIDGFPYLPFHHVTETDESILDICRQMIRIVNDHPQLVEHDDGTTATATRASSSNTSRMMELHDNTNDDTAIVVQRVPGGATNRLYRVNDQYLVRLFGAPGLIDRDEETYYYTQLSRQKLAPRYYGRFANGRIEAWLNTMRTIRTDEIATFAMPIATAMAQLHTTTTGMFFNMNHDHDDDDNAAMSVRPTPSVWIQLDRWLAKAERLHQDCTDDDDEYRLADIRTNLILLKDEMKRFPCATGFCHNDVLAANVLTHCEYGNDNESSNSNKNNADTTMMIQLIDFEYGGLNYCSFDIANHWNEYAGGPPTCTDPDYSKLPNVQEQRAFLRAYNNNTCSAGSNNNNNDDDDDDNDDLLVLLKEVQFFLLVNHLYWGLWAVVQAGTEGCETYDYRRYGRNRIRQYFLDKGKVLQSSSEDHDDGKAPAIK